MLFSSIKATSFCNWDRFSGLTLYACCFMGNESPTSISCSTNEVREETLENKLQLVCITLITSARSVTVKWERNASRFWIISKFLNLPTTNSVEGKSTSSSSNVAETATLSDTEDDGQVKVQHWTAAPSTGKSALDSACSLVTGESIGETINTADFCPDRSNCLSKYGLSMLIWHKRVVFFLSGVIIT